ncbi:MAG TPA: peptidoglycan-binding domain-containing protein, partial [Acidimicrobiales bacterium]|nr:peptidoglycan-binding domain-containing protein [Acidimicrobiales bacterium]
ASIAPGEVLFRVDNDPVVLMAGATPAWRPFVLGMTRGPDVAELQTNLVALGDAGGLFSSADGTFSTLTVDAVERWQVAEGQPATGEIALGEIVFLPSTVLVGTESVAPGVAASPGDVPFQATTTTRVVTVPTTVTQPPVTAGEAVSIVLATDASVPGHVTATDQVLAPQSSSGSGPSSPGSTGFVVVPDDPAATGSGTGVAVQVALTTQAVSHVLAAPVSALLALAGGGYGVEVVNARGAHHLVGVTTGIFVGSQVQVRGAGIHAGTKVVVAE